MSDHPYPPEVAWARFHALMDRMLRSGPPDRRTSSKAASSGVAVLELLHVLLKVLCRDVDVRPADRQLQAAPKAFHGIDVALAPHILAPLVADRLVLVALAAQPPVSAELVGVNGAARLDVLGNDRVKRLLADVRNHVRHHVAAALQHPEDNRLASGTASRRSRPMTADISLVGLDNAAERPLRRPCPPCACGSDGPCARPSDRTRQAGAEAPSRPRRGARSRP